MANLTIDIGNTRTKLGVFEGQNLLETLVVEQLELSVLKAWATNHSVKKVIYSTVAGIEPALRTYLEQYFFCIALTQSTPLPFENRYETPSTLGKDRLAAVAGAQTWSEGQTCLVIDAGTCVTYDYLQMGRIYLGGNIAPGLAMRMKAMHHFTKALPLVEIVGIEKKIGISTQTAMQIGGAWGMILEIQGVIDWALSEFGNLKVFLTGGDAIFFANYLKNKIFVHPNLVLNGLNQILNYNVQLLA